MKILPSSFLNISELPLDSEVPFLDRTIIDESSLSEDQIIWRRDGALIAKSLIPDSLIESYSLERQKRNIPHISGFPDCFAYMRVPEVLAIACYKPLSDLLSNLLGEEMLPHFDLTQWVSTERNWHQDDYLNDESINSHYAAVWFALDDISPDSGPFEFIPTTNHLPISRKRKVKQLLSGGERESPDWPKYSERVLTPIFQELIDTLGVEPKKFLGGMGDALIWHGRLVHRGSKPNIKDKVRKSLIVHYTGISRIDPSLHEVRRTSDGVPYIWHKNVNVDLY
jgi:hypothetical protein